MENNKKRADVRVTEGTVQANPKGATFNKERLKKPLLLGAMGLACAVCLYLIFEGGMGEGTKEEVKAGINLAVPQASGEGLPTDKGKAYEQEMLRLREQQKKEAMISLSDYWQSDSTHSKSAGEDAFGPGGISTPAKKSTALESYRSIQHSLHNFYRSKGQGEIPQGKPEIQKEYPRGQSAAERLALMEQSYKMAAKYFPGAVPPSDTLRAKAGTKEQPDGDFLAIHPGKKPVVSQLRRLTGDSLGLARFAGADSERFTTPTSVTTELLPANSIRACIHQGGKVIADGCVQLRLLQEARIGTFILPRGFILSAVARFQSNRLQLKVVSLEVDGSILPVNLTVYDLDGQQGLNLPYAPEVSAVNGTLANMGSNAGSSFTINRSAGQQAVADLSRGMIQGVSGYFSKKVKAQKATLKAGHQVFLVSKKK